jgi:hypothetical protein
MFRILRAFAWMRWRILINSFDRTGARDVVERFSLAMDQIAPIIALVLLVPSALMMAGMGAVTGYALGHGGEASWLLDATRYAILPLATVFAIVGPMMLPAAGRPNVVRLLLLPIPRGTLYLSQAAGTLSEPWILLTVPLLLAMPAGLLAGGRPAASLVALATGLLLALVLVGISAASSLLLQLVFRDRRRGELAALFFILIVPMLASLPGILDVSERRERARSGGEERPSRFASYVPLLRYAPSELHVAAVRDGTDRRYGPALSRTAALAATALALHGLAFVAFRRLLQSPAATGSRRQAGSQRTAWRALPGVSPGVSAVAIAQIRLALRTPRGRSILLSPLVVFVMFGVLMRRNAGGMDIGFLSLGSGTGLAMFGSSVCLLAILPFAMNQFAIDGAGLTLVLLSPLRDEEYLAGKAIGNAVIVAAPAMLCIVAAYALFPTGEPAVWISIPLGLLSTYVLAAPAAAALSALFPRAVDLNSVGSGSNAQGFAGFVGMLATLAAGAPAAILAFIVLRAVERPALLPAVLVAWCVVAFGVSLLLFRAVRALFHKRRENLALVIS